MLAGGDSSSHTAIGIGTPHTIWGAINWSHTWPTLPMEPLALTYNVAAPTHGASPHGPVSHYLSFTASCIQDRGVNVQGHPPLTIAFSLQTHNTSGTTLNQPSHLPTPNSPLTYGVIRLPAGEPCQLPHYRSSQN